jgi:hypothetical protein
MAEDVDVPKVGPIDKKVVIGVVVAVGGYVGYQYYRSKQMPTTTDTGSTTDGTNPEFDPQAGDPNAVLGAVSPTNSYGLSDNVPTGDAPSTSDFGFHGTTNDAWTQYAAAQLEQSDRWSYTDIVDALGKYLAQRPTTTAEQSIVNAAIAVAGHPPVGSFTLIFAPAPIGAITPTPKTAPATSSQLSVPSGFSKGAVTRTSIEVRWHAVKDAAHYDIDITPGPIYTTNNLQKSITDLKPNTAYQLRIRAVRAGGATGVWSPYITVKTSK